MADKSPTNLWAVLSSGPWLYHPHPPLFKVSLNTTENLQTLDMILSVSKTQLNLSAGLFSKGAICFISLKKFIKGRVRKSNHDLALHSIVLFWRNAVQFCDSYSNCSKYIYIYIYILGLYLGMVSLAIADDFRFVKSVTKGILN